MVSDSTSDKTYLLARQDRIPVWPHPTSLLWVLGAGYFFAFFDIINIGAALPEISNQFGISTNLASWAVTASLLAYIIGSYIDGLIADRWGRRISLMISVAFFTIGSIGAAFSFSIGQLIGWRVIAGMGIGAEIASITTYLSEVSPAAVRGRYTSWANVFAYAGFAFVPLAARGLDPTFEWGWRVLFLIGALGGATILFMRRGLSETPRWLLEHGYEERARELVEKSEQNARAKTGEDLPEAEDTADRTGQKDFSAVALFKPPFLNRVVLLCAIWFIYYIGNYGWLEMAPTLLHRLGYSMTESLSFLIVTGVGFLAGALLSVPYNDRFERKYSLIVIALVWSACLFLIGFWPRPWLIMAAGFVLSTTIGLFVPILYTLTAEHFATRARTTGFALSVGVGHIGGAIAPHAAVVGGRFCRLRRRPVGHGHQRPDRRRAGTFHPEHDRRITGIGQQEKAMNPARLAHCVPRSPPASSCGRRPPNPVILRAGSAATGVAGSRHGTGKPASRSCDCASLHAG